MKKVLKEKIASDIYRYFGKTKIPFKNRILENPLNLQYSILYRKGHFYYNNPFLRMYYKKRMRRLSFKIGYSIPLETEIGDGLYLGHNAPIIINGQAKIGKNVNIAQYVTIGADMRGKRKGAPIIGNDVWIGAGSVIVGNITIGNDVVISPNSFVNFDVKDHCVVVPSTQSRMVSKEKATEGFIGNKVA